MHENISSIAFGRLRYTSFLRLRYTKASITGPAIRVRGFIMLRRTYRASEE